MNRHKKPHILVKSIATQVHIEAKNIYAKKPKMKKSHLPMEIK